MTLVAGTPIGKYVVRRKLAEGGMAEIYLCTSVGPEGFEKEVVIKRVRQGLANDPAFVRMFVSEARLASRLNHPNVVHIYDFAKHEDTYFLAMEYVRGASLYDLRKRCKELMEPISPLLAAQIALEVCRGLGYAHRLSDGGRPLGVVHRDVTPHNVLLSFEGAVKLTDFGIARAGARLTSAGTLKGKFAYMSPEQARGQDVDARTDLFALGIVLWEMLTGGRLFDADSDIAVLRAVQESAIASPRRLNPDVPESLDAIVRKALERDPEKRYQSAHELERALGQMLISEAKRVEDTDVAAFLRGLYPEEAVREATRLSRISAITDSDARAPGSAPRREPTAVMGAAGTPSTAPAVSPDDDPFASTLMVKRELDAAAASPVPAAPAPVSPASAAPASAPVSPSPPRSARRKGTGVMVASAAGAVLLAAAVVVWRAQGTAAVPAAAPVSASADAGIPDADSGSPPNEKLSPVQPPAVAGRNPDGGENSKPPPPPPVDPPMTAKPEPRPATPTKGSLWLRAVPYATVSIDGRPGVDLDKWRKFDLEPGSHQLHFAYKGKRQELTVEVESGKVERRSVSFAR